MAGRLQSLTLASALVVGIMAGPAGAVDHVPGARSGDKAMTCEDVTRERKTIEDEVAHRGAAKASGAKVKKGLFGFVKDVAGSAAPTLIGNVGSGSYVGSIASRSAGSAAGHAISGVSVSSDGAEARPSADQQARLDRLAKIGAYRQCAVG